MRPFVLLALAVLAVGLSVGEAQAQTCTTTWTNTSGGTWATAANWSNGVPTTGSVACLTMAGTYTVTANGITADVLRLGAASGTQTLVSSGAINLSSGEVRANGVLEWTSNYLSSGTLVNRGLVRLTTGVNSRGVSGGATLRNEGVLRWEDTGNVYLGGGARVENAATVEHVGTAGGLYETSGGGTFVNEAGATARKGGAGTWAVNVPSQNAGTLIVGDGGGTLQLSGASAHQDPTVSVAAEGTLSITGPLTLAGTMAGTPAGRLVATNAITAGASAVLDLGGTGFEWTSNYLVYGRLVNEGLLRLTTGVNSRGVSGGATLRNEGTLRWEDDGNVYLGGGARVENTGTVRHVGSGGGLYETSGGGTFVNEGAGVVEKAGTGTWSLSVPSENAGAVRVTAGELRVGAASTQRSPTLTVSADGVLSITSPFTLVGTASGNVAGRLVATADFQADGAATLDLSGTGFEWATGWLNAGTLVNTGVVRLTGGVNGRGPRGEGTVFRNAGALTWADAGNFWAYQGGRFENTGTFAWSGAGRFNLNAEAVFRNEGDFDWTGTGTTTVTGGSRFENAGTFAVTGSGALRGGNGTDTFVNEAEAELVLAPSAPFALGTDMNAFRAVPMTVDLGGAVRLEGEIDARGTDITNRADVFVGAAAGAVASVVWTGDFPLGPDADLHLDLAGLAPGTEYDQLVVLGASRPFARGEAGLDGALSIRLAGAFTPAEGDAFEVVRAPSFVGGFRDLTSLTVEAADLAFYPSVSDSAYVLTTAEGIPTLSGPLTVTPAEATNGALAGVAVAASGFAPDLTLTLECVECADAEAFGVIAGGVLTLTPTAIAARFDLTAGDIFGAYQVVARDPRGGEARAAFTVKDGPPVLSVAVLDGTASEDGRDPGSFVVRSNRRLRSAVEVPFRLSGSARLFSDYMLDRLGRTLDMPAGVDSVVVSVFPLNDDVEESAESVTFQLDGVPDAARTSSAEAADLFATLFIEDGPPSTAFEVYASSPRTAGNRGTLTVTIGGQGLTEAATARLVGGVEVEAYRTSVNEEGTVLEASFDMSDQAEGVRSLVVESGDGETRTLGAALRLESARYPEVFVQVLAPPRVPRTRERSYTVLLHNRGNVGVVGNAALSGLPIDAEWRVDEPEARILNSTLTWRDVARVTPNGETQIISLPTITLAPGETREMTVIAAINSAQTLSLVAAWMYEQ